eukprot:13377034-Alexandrium_andersonii.AAC.1
MQVAYTGLVPSIPRVVCEMPLRPVECDAGPVFHLRSRRAGHYSGPTQQSYRRSSTIPVVRPGAGGAAGRRTLP